MRSLHEIYDMGYEEGLSGKIVPPLFLLQTERILYEEGFANGNKEREASDASKSTDRPS